MNSHKPTLAPSASPTARPVANTAARTVTFLTAGLCHITSLARTNAVYPESQIKNAFAANGLPISPLCYTADFGQGTVSSALSRASGHCGMKLATNGEANLSEDRL